MITYLQQQQKYKISIFNIIAILLALLIVPLQIIQQVKAYPIVSSKSKIINIPSFTRFFSYNNKKNCNILYNKAYQLSYLYNYNSYNFINNNHLQTKIILKMSSMQSASDNNNNNNSNNKIHDISIHWLRNDLRFHDNPILNKVCNESKTIIPLYIINDINEPFAQTPGIKPNIIRVNFLLESIHEINNKLKQIKYNSNNNNSNNNNSNNDKSQIIFIIGKYEDVIIKIIEVMNVNAIYYEQDIAEPIRKLDQIVLNKIEQYNKVNAKHNKKCNIITLQTHTIHTMDIYLSKCKDNVAPSSYTGFTKIFQSLKVPKEIDDVTYVPPLPANTINILKDTFTKENNNKDNENNNNKFIYYNNFNIPTLHNLNYNDIETKLKYRHENGLQFIGGENEGIQLLNTMMARHDWIAKFEKPKTSPNSIKVDTTGLSPYVKHGCISPRRFYNELSKVYSKYNEKNITKPPVSLHGQLMWREYNYLMSYTTTNFDTMINNPIARQIPWDDDPELLNAWKYSKTGYPYIDAIMTQLRETGWIHHLARHSVACFLTRGDLWQSWEKGAEIFEEYLIDADWSINNFNWQWLSCTAHFYQYFRCYSPIGFGKKTDPNGNYIRKWLPIFKDMPAKYIYEPWEAPIEIQKKCGVIIGKNYPHPIVDHKTMSQSNMSRMKDAYDAQKNNNPMPKSPAIRNDSTLQVQSKNNEVAVAEPVKKKRKQ